MIRVPPLGLLRVAQSKHWRKKQLWHVVEPPKSRALFTERLGAPSSLPRVWAGVRHSLILIYISLLISSVGRATRSCWLLSLLLRETRMAFHGTVSNLLFSYSLGRKGTLGWVGGTKMFGITVE